jgi:hypothetical protein
MFKNVLSIFLIASTFLFSCSSNKSKINKKGKSVSLVCLKENDTLFIKIINNTDSVIFVPKEYDGDYTNNDDTLHLETHNKPEYSTTYYYRYRNIFPFEFYTTRKIEGYKPDTIEQVKKQTYFYNQFRVQPILPVKPDSSYTKYTTVVNAVFYNRQFLDKERIEKVNYSLEDYIKFDSLNAKYVTAPITIRYH